MIRCMGLNETRIQNIKQPVYEVRSSGPLQRFSKKVVMFSSRKNWKKFWPNVSLSSLASIFHPTKLTLIVLIVTMWLLALMSMRANACEALRYQIYVVFPQKRISLYCFSPSKPSKNFVSTYITKTANCVVIERKSVHLKITYVANQRCPMLFQGIIFFPKVIMI